MRRGLGEHVCGGSVHEYFSDTSAWALQQRKVPVTHIPLQVAPVAGS